MIKGKNLHVKKLLVEKVEVDPTGKMNGRGAYLTPDTQTLEKAIKTKRLEKTLGVVIDEKVYQKIRRYLVD